MFRHPPRSTRTDTLLPYTTLCRSECDKLAQWHPGATDVDAQRDVAADPRGAHGERQWHRRLFPRLSSRPIRDPSRQDEQSRALEGRCRLDPDPGPPSAIRSEEHTSELQSLMRISYAVFCLKKKKNNTNEISNTSKNITKQY